MSMTMAQLTQAMQDYLANAETSFVNNIPIMVRQTEQRIYNSVQLPVMRKPSSGLQTSATVRTVTAPIDLLAPYELFIVDASNIRHAVINKDMSWMWEAFPNPTVTGMPDFYAMQDAATICFSRIPDQTYPIELTYYAYPTSLVDVMPGNTTWLSQYYDSVLLYGCLVEGYIYLKGEPDLIQAYDTKFKEGLNLLKQLGDGKDRQDTYRDMQTKVKVN